MTEIDVNCFRGSLFPATRKALSMLVRGAAPTFLMVFGSAVARVAVVRYYFLTLDLHAIKPFCRVSRTSLELEYITSSGPGPRPKARQHFGRIIARLAHRIASLHS